VDAQQSTVLLDETDAAFRGDKEYAEALRGVINTGYRRGGTYSRMTGQGAAMTPQDFSTFGAKAIAGIGALPDTIADRSIPIRLKKRRTDETIEPFRRRDAEAEATPLREWAERWAELEVDGLRDARPAVPSELADRAADCWEPLLAIADDAGEEWGMRARKAALELSMGLEDVDTDSPRVRVLADLREAFASDNRDRLPTTELLAFLHGLDESPWSEWYGKPLTSRGLSKLLKPYGIRSRTVWVPEDNRSVKGYLEEQFEDAWSRYLPSVSVMPSEPASQAGSDGFSTPQEPGVLTDSPEAAIPHDKRVLTDLTDRSAHEGGQEGQEASGARRSDCAICGQRHTGRPSEEALLACAQALVDAGGAEWVPA
jgi:hypothetical protein